MISSPFFAFSSATQNITCSFFERWNIAALRHDRRPHIRRYPYSCDCARLVCGAGMIKGDVMQRTGDDILKHVVRGTRKQIYCRNLWQFGKNINEGDCVQKSYTYHQESRQRHQYAQKFRFWETIRQRGSFKLHKYKETYTYSDSKDRVSKHEVHKSSIHDEDPSFSAKEVHIYDRTLNICTWVSKINALTWRKFIFRQ